MLSVHRRVPSVIWCGLLPVVFLLAAGTAAAAPSTSSVQSLPGSARVASANAGIQAIVSRSVDLEGRSPRRGGAPAAVAAPLALVLLIGARQRGSLLVAGRWRSGRAGTGDAQTRAPPLLSF